MLLKNNTCCFCCQKLLILSISEKNQQYNWKLGCESWGRPYLLLIFCKICPPPICCQVGILLKSQSWQHMWCFKLIFKNCQKSTFFENLRILNWISVEYSTCAPDAIFDAASNIASLLLVFNKNVVFRHQMLIFHGYSY